MLDSGSRVHVIVLARLQRGAGGCKSLLRPHLKNVLDWATRTRMEVGNDLQFLLMIEYVKSYPWGAGDGPTSAARMAVEMLEIA